MAGDVHATGNPKHDVSNLDRLREQLNQGGVDLDQMGAKAEGTSQEVQAEVEAAVTEVRGKMADTQEKLEQLHEQGEAASEDMATAFKSAWDTLKEGVDKARSKFENG